MHVYSYIILHFVEHVHLMHTKYRHMHPNSCNVKECNTFLILSVHRTTADSDATTSLGPARLPTFHARYL